MIREREKAIKILNVILEYYVQHEFSSIKTQISVDSHRTIIMIEGEVDPKNLKVKDLESILNHPRLPEYDDYYDSLLTSSDENQINAVGYLVDAAYVKLKGNNLQINLLRDNILD
ncbi:MULTISPECIES: hypothetical protein [Anaerococcus]|jgi:hypothetical protein|uniref:Uncharacterized protein n=1 Tax=Anaerococcus nagyae TaxID=1755241 RepID=A0A3E2TL64_9FIRM|nr:MULTISPECIES: hypothetical protein [Anaerococcus]MBP2069376.1 hypothetical protein [Anaerococcus nagyae]MDU1828693.1 hypothetical protein [Anaerococcus sp.]MDU1864240.1 hypothetical protein [Anaerococcus sp.]MDU2353305.1 hypothetical protein [Anaerococcus sp.]MDU2566428.1 hypothetical protein [Anaerococcus sp.]